jgi:hypothetical protein
MKIDSSGNLLLGPVLTPDNSTQGVFQVYRNHNNGTWSLLRNANTGSQAYAAFVARSGIPSTTNDISVGVTSSGFTPGSGISSSQGFVRTGTQATNGLVIESRQGPILFEPGGISTLVGISTSGDLSANSFSGSGANISNLNITSCFFGRTLTLIRR